MPLVSQLKRFDFVKRVRIFLSITLHQQASHQGEGRRDEEREKKQVERKKGKVDGLFTGWEEHDLRVKEPFSFVSHGAHLSLSVDLKEGETVSKQGLRRVFVFRFSQRSKEEKKKQKKRETVHHELCFDQWLGLSNPEVIQKSDDFIVDHRGLSSS